MRASATSTRSTPATAPRAQLDAGDHGRAPTELEGRRRAEPPLRSPARGRARGPPPRRAAAAIAPHAAAPWPGWRSGSASAASAVSSSARRRGVAGGRWMRA
ncbi:MAG TPA: hypothetical protein VHT91_13165 [Kofleriaceae bacterium]|nr:hypothetical protein [Kofleriaceae bacterium]